MSHRQRKSVALFGVPFDNVTMREAVDLIEKQIDERGFHQVATANLDFVMNAISDKALQRSLCGCDLIVPDGMPIVWASHLMGTKLKERIAGVDLIPHLAELSCRRGYGIYLLGASEDNSRRAAELLVQRFPGLRIVGRHSPPVAPIGKMDHDSILARIERARPDILLVAMGHPKQEQWLAANRHRLNVPLCMGIGGSLDIIAGTLSRAPVWMQTTGLEWFFRFCQEPTRLGRRYGKDAYGLIRHLPPQFAATAIQPRRASVPAITVWKLVNARVISIDGDLTTSLLAELDAHIALAIHEERHVILDLAKAAYIGPDAIASLLHSAIELNGNNRQLLLAEIPNHLRRVLDSAQLKHCFVTSPSVPDAVYRINKDESRLPSELVAMSGHASVARSVHVQVEMLKDFCERIIAVSHSPQFLFDPRSGATTSQSTVGIS
jgi:N-acetylglucosaminyldiphosphoundecaprenol N-acetyl-beta-D-mannosaminyltransferase